MDANSKVQQHIAGAREDSAAGLLLESLLSVRQVARIWGVCEDTVYRMINRGELRHTRVSNCIRVKARDAAEVGAAERAPDDR